MDHPGGSSHRSIDFDSIGLSAVEGENMDMDMRKEHEFREPLMKICQLEKVNEA